MKFVKFTCEVYKDHRHSNHHRQHTEVGFLANDPDNIALSELTLCWNCADMTFCVLHSNHHAMVTQAEVYVLQSVAYEGTTLAKLDRYDGEVVLLLVPLL